MEFVVLVENLPNPDIGMLTEHGLSIYCVHNNTKWLFDTGASDAYLQNAHKLGINIAEVDYLFLSHGHNDHTGGLESFLNVNLKAKIILSEKVLGNTFLSTKYHPKKDISIRHELIYKHLNRCIFINSNKRIQEDFFVVNDIPAHYAVPKGNRHLLVSSAQHEQPDTFEHEIALAIQTPKGIIILSGCAHRGILNILAACETYFVNTPLISCIGGTHLLNSHHNCIYETDEEIESIANIIRKKYPGLKLISGHCAGENSKMIMNKILSNDFETIFTGKKILFN
jgi:7,8-dihydropterin-6-yl-methyl-4-(beta-D-ribofuranosyl)aminobenzene 5'-phosphate synthase